MDSISTEIKPKPGVCFGDGPIGFGALNTQMWLLFYYSFGQGLIKLFWQWTRFNTQALAFCLTSIFRTKFGIQNIGFIISLYAVATIFCFNSTHLYGVFAPFAVIVIPALPWIYEDWVEIYALAFVDIKSRALLVWAFLVLLGSMVNTLISYLGFGDQGMVKRGTSLIYLGQRKLLRRFRWFNPSEFIVICFVECVIVAVVGFLSLRYWGDPTFGWFCISVAMSELFIQVKAKITHNREKAKLHL